MPAKKSTKKPAKKSAKQMPPPRVAVLAEEKLTPPQRALLDSIRSGPRGGGINIRGPFAVFLHAPEFGELAQQLGGYCRYKTAVPPRLSEFAILVTAKPWRAQYEWFAHVPQAERAGVKPATIRDLHQGRVPKSAPKDERAIYDFVQELYKTRRVSDKNFKRVSAIPGVVLHTIDDIQGVVDHNLAMRAGEVPRVEHVIADEAARFDPADKASR